MKETEFNVILRQNSNKNTGLLDVEKVRSLNNEIKEKMLHYIVRKRMAIVTAFINDLTDMQWLHSMGYLYTAKNKAGFELLCTCETLPKIKK